MNLNAVNELADLIEFDAPVVGINKEAAVMLRQLKTERDWLFKAHSYEMARADQLAAEVDNYKTECNRLYRIIELNVGQKNE